MTSAVTVPSAVAGRTGTGGNRAGAASAAPAVRPQAPMGTLTQEQIEAALDEFDGWWGYKNGASVRTQRLNGFVSSTSVAAA
jgi:hypothetical protein